MRRVNTVCIITGNGNGKEEKGVTGGRAKWGCGGGGEPFDFWICGKQVKPGIHANFTV